MARRSATMAIVILLYDQLLFRPIVAWADKFRFETDGAPGTSAFLGLDDLVRRTRLLPLLAGLVEVATVPLQSLASVALRRNQKPRAVNSLLVQAGDYLWLGIVIAAVACGLWPIIAYVRRHARLGRRLEAVGARSAHTCCASSS